MRPTPQGGLVGLKGQRKTGGPCAAPSPFCCTSKTMSMKTVEVKHPTLEGETMVINESDYKADQKKWTLAGKRAAAPKAAKPVENQDAAPKAGEAKKKTTRRKTTRRAGE